MEHMDIRLEDLFPNTGTNCIHSLPKGFWGRNAPRESKSVFVELWVILHLSNSFELSLSLTEQANIAEQNVAVLDLWLAAFLIYWNMITEFYKITLTEHSADNTQSARCNDALVTKYDIETRPIHSFQPPFYC